MDEKPSGELLQEPTEIYRALRALQLTRSLVTIKIDNDPQIYSSMILLCDLDNAQFILDEVRPAAGDWKLKQGASFTLMGFYDGIQVLCKDNCVASAVIPELSNAYSIDFPPYVYRKQRRESFRASISSSLATEVTLSSKHRDKSLTGTIVDISTSGIGCEFSGFVRPELKRGEVFDTAIVSINGEFTLHCSLSVRYPHYNKAVNITQCGLQFSQLDRITQKKLDRYLSSLQRQARRTSKQADTQLRAG